MDNKFILKKLLDGLWKDYIKRVHHARKYQELILERGGNVINDHIAFRSFKTEIPNQETGIIPFVKIFEAFQYQVKASYKFQKKKLNAIHLEHEDKNLPKIFVSEILVDEFSNEFKDKIHANIASCKEILTHDIHNMLNNIIHGNDLDEKKIKILLKELSRFFSRPWAEPRRDDIFKINSFSQYAAWLLLHGNSVNHFTAFINFQNVKELPDIETTLALLDANNVPLKLEIEGVKGSKLRQSSTEAVIEKCKVRNAAGELVEIPWSYA